MKKYMKNFWHKANIWSLFIGLVIGFGLGVYFVNLLIPNANELIRIYHLNRNNIQINQGEQK